MGKFVDFMKSVGGASVGSSAIEGLFGIGGSLISAAASKKIAREQNAYNEEMWRKQNEYNTPQAQKQRLIEAGLNPALMYQNGGVSNVAETPQPASNAAVQSPNHIMDGVLAAGQAIGGAVKSALEAIGTNIGNQQKQQDLEEKTLGQPFRLKQQEHAAEIAKYEAVSAEARSIIDSMNSRIGLATEDVQIDSIKQNLANQRKEFENLQASIDYTIIRTDREREELERLIDSYALDMAIKEATLADLEKGIEVSDSVIAENYAAAEKFKQDKVVGRYQVGYLQAQGQLSAEEKKQVEYYNSQLAEYDKQIKAARAIIESKNADNYDKDRAWKILWNSLEGAAKISYSAYLWSHEKRGASINDAGVGRDWVMHDTSGNSNSPRYDVQH